MDSQIVIYSSSGNVTQKGPTGHMSQPRKNDVHAVTRYMNAVNNLGSASLRQPVSASVCQPECVVVCRGSATLRSRGVPSHLVGCPVREEVESEATQFHDTLLDLQANKA